jgi:hypothetical protein
MGAGLGPAFQSDMSFDYTTSAFTSINNPSVSSGSMQTVSPKDIFNDPLSSAPPSTAFTNLTSPDVGQSPYLNDSFDTSPMFHADPMDSSIATHNWFSLFPENETKPSPPALPVAPALERSISTSSMARSTPSSAGSPAPVILDGSHRRKSSTTGSPATNAGVTKPRRRKAPLPPIAVDPNDKIALKRARNTLAARDSRQRKFDHVQTLEKQVEELKAEREKWRSIALALGYADVTE